MIRLKQVGAVFGLNNFLFPLCKLIVSNLTAWWVLHTQQEKVIRHLIFFSYSFTISLGTRAAENDGQYSCPCYCFQFPTDSQATSTWYNVQEKYLILDQAGSTRFGVGIGQETFQRCPLYSPGNKYVLFLFSMFYKTNICRLQVRYH